MAKQSATRTPEQLVRKWMREAWKERRKEAVEACFDPQFLGYDGETQIRGLNGVHGFFRAIHGAFGNLSVRIDDVLTEEDRVAVQITARGRHTGDFMGYPTSKADLTFPALMIFRVHRGRFLEAWQYWDLASVVRALRLASGGAIAGLPESSLRGNLGPAPATRRSVGRQEKERNKEAVRHWLNQAWNQRRIDVTDELISDTFIFNDAFSVIRGRTEMRAWVEGLHAAITQISLSIDDLVAEGDKVACRLSFEGVHRGDLFGIPPTAEPVTSGAIFIVRIVDGRFREAWQVWDLFAVLQQIGAL